MFFHPAPGNEKITNISIVWVLLAFRIVWKVLRTIKWPVVMVTI